MLAALLSPDNATRNAAEKALEELQESQPTQLAHQLVETLAGVENDAGARSLCAVLLRRLAGGLTFLAGLYLTLYWGRVFFDSTPGLDQIASAVGAYASGAAMLISSPLGIGVLLLGAFLAAGLAGVLILHGQRRSSVRPSSD